MLYHFFVVDNSVIISPLSVREQWASHRGSWRSHRRFHQSSRPGRPRSPRPPSSSDWLNKKRRGGEGGDLDRVEDLLENNRPRIVHVKELEGPADFILEPGKLCSYWNLYTSEVSIHDICHYFYTHTFWGVKVLHSKVQKFATENSSRQNRVNYQTHCV